MNAVQPIRLVVLVLAIWATMSAVRGDDIRIREDVDELLKPANKAKLDALKLAFKTLQDSTDPKSNMKFWANIHDAPFPETTTGPCEHVSELIWPWHRAYLYEFETALRKSHPPETNNVTLPYWNWCAPPTGSRLPKIYEEMGSSLNYSPRSTGAVTVPPVSATGEKDLLNIPLWEVFGGPIAGQGSMEHLFHDAVHGFIGGDNHSTAKSARDPIFWAHHANLDRIWLAWQAKYGVNPVGQTKTIAGLPGTTVKDWNDVSMKYKYGPKVAPDSDVPNRLFTNRLILRKTTPGATYPVKVPAPAADERLVLRLKNVRPPSSEQRFFTAEVFLHPKDVDLSKPADNSKYFLTQFARWDSHHTQGHKMDVKGSTAVDMLFDVTARAREIVKTTGDQPLFLTVQFVGINKEGEAEQFDAGGDAGFRVGEAEFYTRPVPPAKK